jgi:hypothetical protein
LAENSEFIGRWQMSKPEQVANLLKDGMVGQIVDVISAIGKHSLITVDITDARSGSDNAFQSLGGVQIRNAGHGSSLAIRMDDGTHRVKTWQSNFLLYAKAMGVPSA